MDPSSHVAKTQDRVKTGPKKEVSFDPHEGNVQMGEAEFTKDVIETFPRLGRLVQADRD